MVTSYSCQFDDCYTTFKDLVSKYMYRVLCSNTGSQLKEARKLNNWLVIALPVW